MSEEKKNLIERIKGNKFIQYLLIFILIIVLLFVVFNGMFVSNNEENDQSTDAVELYVTGLEKRISDVLSGVEGVGKVSVVITIESGMETVLAMKTEITETSDGVIREETPILVNGKTVVLKENYPKVTGVLVVAEGAKSISVMNKIQQATLSLLDINVDQIEILTMK